MPRRKRLIDKELTKRVARKCRLCPTPLYEALDCHRIIPGEEGGEYTNDNVLVVCAVCHRLIHAGFIVVHRWYQSTAGRVIHVTRDGKEEFL